MITKTNILILPLKSKMSTSYMKDQEKNKEEEQRKKKIWKNIFISF